MVGFQTVSQLPCSFTMFSSISCLREQQADDHTWAARHNTRLLFKLTPKGVLFAFLMTIPLSCALYGTALCCPDLQHCTGGRDTPLDGGGSSNRGLQLHLQERHCNHV